MTDARYRWVIVAYTLVIQAVAIGIRTVGIDGREHAKVFLIKLVLQDP